MIPDEYLSSSLRRDLTLKENLENLVKHVGALKKFKDSLKEHIAQFKFWPVTEGLKNQFRNMVGNFLVRIKKLNNKDRDKLVTNLNLEFAKDNDEIAAEIKAIIELCEGVAPQKAVTPRQPALPGGLSRRHSMSPNYAWAPSMERKSTQEKNELTSGANGVVQRRPLGSLSERRRSQSDQLTMQENQLVWLFRGHKVYINLRGISNMQDMQEFLKVFTQRMNAVEATQQPEVDIAAFTAQAQAETDKVYELLENAGKQNEQLRGQLEVEIEKNRVLQEKYQTDQKKVTEQMISAQGTAETLRANLEAKITELSQLEQAITKLVAEKSDLPQPEEQNSSEKTVTQEKQAKSAMHGSVALEKQPKTALEQVEVALNELTRQKTAVTSEVTELRKKLEMVEQNAESYRQAIQTLQTLLLQVVEKLEQSNQKYSNLQKQAISSAKVPRLSVAHAKRFLPGLSNFMNKPLPAGAAANGSLNGPSAGNGALKEGDADKKDKPRAA